MTALVHRTQELLRSMPALAFALLCPVLAAHAQGDIELRELQIALSASQAQVQKLHARVGELEAKSGNLGEALAAANAESEHFRGAYQNLRERIEALGIAAIDPDPSSLQAQYIRALSDYRLSREENDRLTDTVGKLSAAINAYMKSAISSNLDDRLALEVALREANLLAAGAARPAADAPVVSLQDARVISVKSDFDLAVLNIGRNSGVQVGMPFQILRKDRPIGKGLAIDVRDHICGIVVQDLIAGNDPVQLGDSATVDPTHQSTL